MISDQNPKIQMLPVADIDLDAENRLRPVSEAGVESMIASIEELGIIKDAIHVRKKRRATGETLVLMAGGHRLEAAKRLGWDAIPARVWADITNDDARFMEIDDNLAGKALDPLDQAEFLAERKRVYEKAHPEAKHGGARKGQAFQNQAANLAICSFVKSTAESTGLSERNIQRRVMVGQKLSKADIKALREAPVRIKASELEALAKINEPIVRADVVGKLASGETKSVFDALAVLQPKPEGVKTTAPNPVIKAWNRASAAEKRQFAEEFAKDLQALLGGKPLIEAV